MCHRNVRTVTAFDSKLQSCGLCDGMEPALSNTCYDKAGVCSWAVENHCYLNQDVCKKVREDI